MYATLSGVGYHRARMRRTANSQSKPLENAAIMLAHRNISYLAKANRNTA